MLRVLSDFCKNKPVSLDETIAGLKKLPISTKSSKENGEGEGAGTSAQQCLKIAHKKLAQQPCEDAPQLASLCQQCLRVMQQHTVPARLHTAAYATIRLLVSAKQFNVALEEGLRLHQALEKQHSCMFDPETPAKDLPADVVNMGVGTIITLALCWAEGADIDASQVEYILSAAEAAHACFRLLKPQDAAKHSQTLFKSLYRGSLKLLEAKNWAVLKAACVSMLAVGTPEQTLATVAKLAPHVPDPHGITLISNALTSPAIISSLERSADDSLATAVLNAALGPATLLRKRASAAMSGLPSSGALVQAFEDPPRVSKALDVAASIVGVGAKLSPDGGEFARHGNSAAVSLVCGARLKAALVRCDGIADWEATAEAASNVLGAAWPEAAASTAVLSLQELSWLSSSMYNVGLDLLSDGSAASAVQPLLISLSAAAAALQHAEGGEDVSRGATDMVKRLTALTEALAQAGRPGDAAAAATQAVVAALCACPNFPSALLAVLVSTAARYRASDGGGSGASAPPRKQVAAKRGSSKARKSTADAADDALPCCCITAAVQQLWKGSNCPPEILSKLAQAELAGLAAAASSVDVDVGSTEAVVQHLLRHVFPQKTAPIEHVRILLLAHFLKLLPAESSPSSQRSAEKVLRSMTDAGDASALVLTALAAALRVLDEAQAVAQAALEQQAAAQQTKREQVLRDPTLVHAGGSNGSCGGEESKNRAQNAERWAAVLQDAAEAGERVTAAGEQLAKHGGRCSCEEWELCGLASAARELTALAGIHGELVLERDVHAAIRSLSTSDFLSNSAGDGLRPALESCLLPRFSVSDADAAEEEAGRLSGEASRCAGTLLRRADLLTAAALGHAAAGTSIPALHCAAEAHRLLTPAVREAAPSHQPASLSSAASEGVAAGWWQLAVAYCRSLMLLGRLFEASGMADEASAAWKEGQRMGEALGAPLLDAAFSAQLALLWSSSPLHAAAAADTAQARLDAISESSAAGVAAQWVEAHLTCAQARLYANSDDPTQALLSSHRAVEICQNAAEEAADDAEIAPHLAAALATALLARIHALQAEGIRPAAEVSAAAAEALQQLEGVNCAAFGAAQRASLLLVHAAGSSEPVRVQGEPLAQARLWAPGQFDPELESSTSCTADAWASDPLLWRALVASRTAPHVHRLAATQLAPACAAAGHSHLAALLLHAGAGATLQAQHRLVLHARERQAGRRRQPDAQQTAAQALGVLEAGIDWSIASSLADRISDAAQGSKPAPKRGGAGRRCCRAPPPGPSPAASLEALDAQAAETLDVWLSVMPEGTVVCTVGARTLRLGSHNVAHSQLQECLVVSRLQAGGTPPLILDIPVLKFGSAASQHPIRALALDGEDAEAAGTGKEGAVGSAVAQMQRLLDRSMASMKKMPTETSEQRREWWRARVELDDGLAGLLRHVDSSWLGPWRCLLVGSPEDSDAAAQHAQRAAAALERIQMLRKGGGEEGVGGAVEVLVAAVAYGAPGMVVTELRQAANVVCAALGLPYDAVGEAAKILSQGAPAAKNAEHDEGLAAAAAGARAAPAPLLPRLVKFKDEEEEEREDSAAAGMSPPPALRSCLSSAELAEGGRGGNDLCGSFDAMGLGGGDRESLAAGAQTPAPTTLQPKKHRSRLGLMQAAATPARHSTRKPRTAAPDTAPRAAFTAPRAPRPAATPAAATVPVRARPAARSGASSAPHGAPVVAIFDPFLQCLPWESVPGLAGHRMYRLPALPCAAAAAGDQPVAPQVDLSSAYYAINPSGDLQSTQDTFEAWFQGLKGWEGRAGSPPPAAELAAALEARQLFVYCGHGGGEQYIPPARLRALPRCAASLLMGCSSGRLRTAAGPVYEPTGVVLAYLLAGCPVAVANLWDVTDRDIDRFAQAVLLRWLSGNGCEGGDGAGGDVAAAVAAARGACKLPSLIGAAPVCYGVPTQVKSMIRSAAK